IDWAEERHVISLREADSEKVEHCQVANKPELIREWINELHGRFPGRRIAIALEQFRGALIYQLMEFDFLVLFPINPKTISKYREALRSSGAKDDPSDARLLMHFLQTHMEFLRALEPQDPLTLKLRKLVEYRRKIVDQCSSLTRRIQQELKSYFPQSVNWLPELDTQMACDFLTKWPTLEAVKKVKPEVLRNFFRKHNCRKNDLIEWRLKEIKLAVAPTHNQAIISASVLIVKSLVSQLQVAMICVKNFDREIQDVFKNHPDRFFYESLPGAGPALEPRLAVAMGMDRNRYQSAIELQQFSGIAPVTDTSGKNRWVHWRWACPKFTRQTFVEFAACSLPKSVWAKACYDQQRALRKGHHAALRVVAFKWQRILFACWKNRQPYDENKYLHNLKPKSTFIFKPVILAAKANKPGFESASQIIGQLKSRITTQTHENPCGKK
ncbi:IS110 family transposase, partial [bacterium]|nr:IS110 family transposase [bacterium]